MKVNTAINMIVSWSLYAASIVLYMQPITGGEFPSALVQQPTPVLDEMYIQLDGNNNDVKIDPESRTPLVQVFQNDYWGRPMNSPSSHKSYRPITILSLRLGYYIAEYLEMNGLFIQRLLNIAIHAVLVQMVGRLYVSLFPSQAQMKNTITRTIASMLFMLHPTHIESVVNGANRAHLLSLLLVITSLDLSLNAIIAGLFYAMGLLSCETGIFLFPAICLSWIFMDYQNYSEDGILKIIWKRLPRLSFFSIITFAYVSMRYYLDWIEIPRGLIRPAENPFYEFMGMDRVLNYSYIMSVHIVKSIGIGVVDLVGFSHEYGFDCVERIDSFKDGRLLFPFVLVAIISYLLMVSCRNLDQTQGFSVGQSFIVKKGIILWVLTFGAWMATLFPVSGIIRVGTFIADRIVISSTVASTLLWTRLICVTGGTANRPRRATFLSVIVLSIYLWTKIQRRSTEWMCPKSLLQSSLRACPRGAKSHLEMGKVYSSGLFGEQVDLEKALYLFETANDIDPNFCDVNSQLAQIYIQTGEIMLFEEKLTKAVLCKFTMSGSQSMFQQYWKHTLNDPNPQVNTQDARKRYDAQMAIIQAAILKEQEEEKARSETVSNDTKSEL